MTEYNIVLVTVDCFRYDRCRFNGFSRDTTPFLDSLADESYVFDNAYATGPYTPESVPGFLAGQFAKSAPYSENLICKAIGHDDPTLPLHLRDQGYRTLATITNTHLSANRNFDRGFDEFTNLRLQESQPMEERKEADGFLDRLLDELQTRAGAQTRYPNVYVPMYVAYRYRQLRDGWPTVDGSRVIEEFLDDLSALTGERPVLAWTHLMDLHAPLHPDKVDPDGGIVDIIKHLSADAARMSDIRHPRYVDMYESTLSYVDDQIQRLVRGLEDLDLWDETVLIVTGDHGEALGERDVYEHPWHHMDDELLKVPLLVRVPGADTNRIETPFSLAWLHELIGEVTAAGPAPLPTESPYDSVLSGTQTEEPIVVSDSVSTEGYSIAIRDSEYRYVRHYLDSDVSYVDDEEIITRSSADQEEPDSRDAVQQGFREIAEEYRTRPEDVPALEADVGAKAREHLEELGYM